MFLREPVSPKAFKDLLSQRINFTMNFEGDFYCVPSVFVPVFDHTKFTMVICPEGSPADFVLLPAQGNADFKHMALLAPKKSLRIYVPNLEGFSLKLDT